MYIHFRFVDTPHLPLPARPPIQLLLELKRTYITCYPLGR